MGILPHYLNGAKITMNFNETITVSDHEYSIALSVEYLDRLVDAELITKCENCNDYHLGLSQSWTDLSIGVQAIQTDLAASHLIG